jgi:hypothetical protein
MGGKWFNSEGVHELSSLLRTDDFPPSRRETDVRQTRWFTAFAVAVSWGTATVFAADADRRPAREVASFGTLRSTAPEAVRAQAEGWLRAAGKGDDVSLKAFNEAWQSDRPVLDKLADTFSLGDVAAAKLLATARESESPAPTALPDVLKDSKKPAFFRANLALAYAKALANRKVYEEGLEALKAVQAEDVADPGAYFFTRAIAEHSLMMKSEANNSIARLLDDVADAPERYRMVATLMQLDMLTWQEKDLGWIARKMDNIQRRLDMSRGGPKTRKMQKDVLLRLDEMIKQVENQSKGNSQANGGNCPNGGQRDGPNSMTPSNPLNDSQLGGRSGPGQVDPKKFKELAEVWGKLPEKERAKAIVGLTRDLDPRYREAIETYFKKLSASSDKNP